MTNQRKGQGIVLRLLVASCLLVWSMFSDGKPDPPSFKQSFKQTVWWTVASEHGLDPYILYAVALVESAQVSHRMAAPWPWALNKHGKSIIPASYDEARLLLQSALAKGDDLIDVGLMQINVKWHGHRVEQPEQLLDPATNIEIGADILTEAMHTVPDDLALGIGRYHTGWSKQKDNTQKTIRAYFYGRRVLAIAHRIRMLL